MKISACVIVKNEENNIQRWLDSMKTIADEMVVVDTGSTDGTKEIAKKNGAKVESFQWCNDFSAAKNFAIGKCTGDWILFLDADEYFTDSSRQIICGILKRYLLNKKIGSVMCRLTNIDVDNHNRRIDTMLHLRIFRNIPGMKYVGTVHERLINTIGNKLAIVCNELEIFHTGYSASIQRKKAERNLILLEERIKVEGETNENILYMMDTCNSLGRYEEAIQYAHKVIQKNITVVGVVGHPYIILLSAMIRAKKKKEDIYQVFEEAIEKYPEEPNFYLEYGYTAWKEKDYDLAEKYILLGFKFVDKYKNDLENGKLRTDNFTRSLHLAYYAMGELLFMREDKAGAAGMFADGIRVYKYHAGLLQGLYRCISDADPVDIIGIINSYYDKKKDGVFVSEALQQIASSQVFVYYADKDNLDTYLAMKHFNGAAVEAVDQLSRMYRLAVISAIKVNAQDNLLLNTLLPTEYRKILHNPGTNDNKIAQAIHRMMR